VLPASVSRHEVNVLGIIVGLVLVAFGYKIAKGDRKKGEMALGCLSLFLLSALMFWLATFANISVGYTLTIPSGIKGVIGVSWLVITALLLLHWLRYEKTP
jgi:hypothetical protein